MNNELDVDAGTSMAAEQIASRICDARPMSVRGRDIVRRGTLSNVVSYVVSQLRKLHVGS